MPKRLPIDEIKEQVMAELARWSRGDRLVISAPTGSGKSTRLPLWCRQAGHGKTLVIEPRRLACRTLADWVASALGQKVGETVGYSVRREQAYCERTEILFVTPGVARRMVSENEIDRFATVIFDEFHERGWESDTVMALLAAREERAPRLLLMSATLESQALSRAYRAKTIEGSGRSYPVEIRYQATPEVVAPSVRDLKDRVVDAIRTNWNGQGRMLVFLPGIASMQEVKTQLRDLPVRLLHGTFNRQRQDQAFGGDEAGILLATNVAESSLTVPGVTFVVDSGLEKRAIHQSGYVALATVPISSASADQRAGRAGRTSPGTCLRLWDAKARLEPTRPPDLARIELDDLLLFLGALEDGTRTPCTWLDVPPTFAWDRALLRLQTLGLIDNTGRLTALGTRAESLPVDTAWARILALAPETLGPDLCDLYAYSATRRSWIDPHCSADQAEQRRSELGEEPWARALATVRRGETVRHGLDGETLEEARTVSQELCTQLNWVYSPAQERVHPDLKEFLARHWPERHFARRQTRDAWGNGEVECRAGRGETLPEDCLAALFLRVEPVLGRGLKVELRGHCALPVDLSLLRACEYGEPQLSKIRWKESAVVALVSKVFAGRVIGQSEERLSGAPLRQALVELCRDGQWRAELFPLWETFCFYQTLQEALEGGRPNPPRLPEVEFLDRLSGLGLENVEELELLEPRDLEPSFSEANEELKKSFPQLYHYGGVAYDALYRPEHRKATLRWRSGPRGARPNPAHLPRWNGWRVEVDERGRVTPLRG